MSVRRVIVAFDGSPRGEETAFMFADAGATAIPLRPPCPPARAGGALPRSRSHRVAYDDSPEARAAPAVAYDIAAPSRAAVTLTHALPGFGQEEVRRATRLRAQAVVVVPRLGSRPPSRTVVAPNGATRACP